MIYLDTSAFAKLHVAESDSLRIVELVQRQSDPLPLTDIQEAELINAIYLKVFWKLVRSREAATQIDAIRKNKKSGLYYTPDINRNSVLMTFLDLAVHTQTIGSRTLDILHVAYAVQLQPDIFVTFDDRQRKLARKAGLHVWTPPT